MAAQAERIKVCVIGAGAAGLCAGRHLGGNTKFETTIYEQTSDIGGTWVYKEQVGLDENGLPIHSSMYQNLRTNLPARIMNFPDYITMEGQQPSCVSHQEVLNYLKNYTQHFDINQYIHFNTRVEHVRFESATENCNRDRWSVRVKNLKTNETKVRYFDAIMVCNGHYFDPYVPIIPGIESFPGLILHSHVYRKPEEFFGKTVLVLGAASSGIDIGIDLSDYATRVYLSHNHDRLTSPLPSNMMQVAGVERVHETTFHLKDGSTVDVDVFLFCTGYKYNFPFLDENCAIRVDNNYVTPLYKHLVNIEHPTICIVGIPMIVVPFPMFHMQVQYFLALLEGRVTLPTKSVMLEDFVLKTPKRHAHKLMDHQWDYNDLLATAGGFDQLPLFYKLGYTAWSAQRRANLLHYKDSRFVISEDGQSVELIIPN